MAAIQRARTSFFSALSFKNIDPCKGIRADRTSDEDDIFKIEKMSFTHFSPV